MDEPIRVRNQDPALFGISSKECQMKFAGKTVHKFAVLAAVAGTVLGLANPVFAANAGKNAASVKDAGVVKAIETQ
jgi:hypothetical protein